MTDGMRTKMESDKIKKEYLNGIYSELAEVIGIDSVIKLHRNHRGQTITLPVDLYSKKYIADLISAEYDGSNIRQLATKYGYTDKWIRHIIKEKLSESNKK